MGMSPGTIVPQNFSLKSFWSRPEGKAGMIAIGLAVAAFSVVGIYEWGIIVPFLVNMMFNTVQLVLTAVGLGLFLWALVSKRTHLIFRLLMRQITGLIIPIDPIGILKDRLLQMRKKREAMDGQISAVSGQIRFLKDTISKNHSMAETNMKQAETARQMSAKAADAAEQLRMKLAVGVNANKAGRLENANISYNQLLTKLVGIYDLLTKWAAHVDAYIEDTSDEVKQQEIQYKALNTAYRAYKQALSVIKGSATEEDIYNTTMEYLAEQAGQKLGEMDDFSRVAQGFMDNVDIQNGAVTQDALNKLDAYEAKLALPGNTETQFLLPGATTATPVLDRIVGTGGQKVATKVASASSSDDYNSFFK